MESKVPNGAEELDTVYSNYDHELDEEVVAQLLAKSGAAFARHSGWNFNGRVWHLDGKWYEEVWTYGSPVELLSGEVLKELIEEVNLGYGSD